MNFSLVKEIVKTHYIYNRHVVVAIFKFCPQVLFNMIFSSLSDLCPKTQS